VTAVWLVDNGSAVDRSHEACALWPGLRVVRLEQNYGFAGGMNRALRLAAVEGHGFAYLLNNDCSVVPGFLRAALEAARRADVAIVGSRVADFSNSLVFDGKYYRPGEKPLQPSRSSRVVSQVNGAGMLVRVAVVESCGYFDERFFCYHEEGELGRRLTAAGWCLVIANDSVVVHTRAGSDIGSNALYYRTRNRFLLAGQRQGWPRWKAALLALRRAAVRGREARSRGNHQDWEAVATAVYDALRGQFGQRRVRPEPIASWLLRLLCVLLAPRVPPQTRVGPRAPNQDGRPRPERGVAADV
jgi:GT2 family glycosyltransferase